MTDPAGLRAAIAVEAARLLLRRKESDYSAARIRASRWLSRRRVGRDEMPSRDEIEQQLYLLAGLESAEHQAARLRELRLVALELAERIASFDPRLVGPVVDGPVTPGAEIVLLVSAAHEDGVFAALAAAPEASDLDDREPRTLRLRFRRFPCTIVFEATEPAAGEGEGLALSGLTALVRRDHEADGEDEGPGDGDAAALDILRMLLARLEDVRLDPDRHPEGDALYHALQVFEHGRAERPWDEEFLLACLVHDVGLAIDPRHRTEAAVETLAGLVTERTRSLVEQLPRLQEGLRGGSIPRSLRKNEHYEDLRLLERCCRAGRVSGAETCTLDEALEYVAGLEDAWED